MIPNPVVVQRHDRYQVITLAGDLDHAAAAHLDAQLRDVTETATATIVDLTAVTFLDSSGLRLLDRLVRTCTQRRAPIRIVAPRPGAARFTMELIGFRPELLTQTAEEATATIHD